MPQQKTRQYLILHVSPFYESYMYVDADLSQEVKLHCIHGCTIPHYIRLPALKNITEYPDAFISIYMLYILKSVWCLYGKNVYSHQMYTVPRIVAKNFRGKNNNIIVTVHALKDKSVPRKNVRGVWQQYARSQQMCVPYRSILKLLIHIAAFVTCFIKQLQSNHTTQYLIFSKSSVCVANWWFLKSVAITSFVRLFVSFRIVFTLLIVLSYRPNKLLTEILRYSFMAILLPASNQQKS